MSEIDEAIRIARLHDCSFGFWNTVLKALIRMKLEMIKEIDNEKN